ncbi:MAG: hypothetical protein QXD59_08130 [Candidatus Caldarchaeum sp.]
MLNDYIGVGAERHKREIVHLIERALAGKVPITPKSQPFFWPRPPVQQAVVVVFARYGGFNRRNVVRAMRDTERRLETVEKLNETGKFYCEEDYRYTKGIYTMWLKLYKLGLSYLDKLMRGEDAVLIYAPVKERREMVYQRLIHVGVPHLRAAHGFVIPREFIRLLLR